ncbi:hypothetical protein QE250_02380 [Chromatiaceae bacterium AAb-1]|nr:hypothetical protein [Chromatiaceae bacterium AAb-1]
MDVTLSYAEWLQQVTADPVIRRVYCEGSCAVVFERLSQDTLLEDIEKCQDDNTID